ncbi:MAG TPA: hypothetical protein VFH15_06335 [Pyrinomonadaceae bacterium]|nr:hypothetical protein [Pyrinomonadaceae bacterium]
MPYKPLKAFGYAVLIWVVGFVWGSIVFMTPALRSTPPIPYVSRNPAISFPIILIWTVLTLLLARSYLKAAREKEREGLGLGLIFVIVNFVLDLVVLVLLLQTGFGYFISASVWFAYATLFLIPWLTGRTLASAPSNTKT